MNNVQMKVRVAISSDFLFAFARIPRNQQAKVMSFVSKFRNNPTASGINYEKIGAASDKNLRSVRIDEAYRGIVLKPDKDNVYVLLWVDHHDEAYRWAENKQCLIHPETGSIQILDVDSERPEPVLQAATEQRRPLFEKIRDREMARLGVPADQLQLVRAVCSDEELDRLADRLPQEAYEALYYLSQGMTYEEVLRDLDRDQSDRPVDTADFAAALDNPDTQRRFYVVEDDLELTAIMQAPLEQWRIFLHPSQRRLVERQWNGPVRVLGGAGTGKTVAAMHRARWLAEKVFNQEGDRILFTTFTRNLAADIQASLGKICSRETLRRIEVVNLDRWVGGFLRKNGYEREIYYPRGENRLWNDAMNLKPADVELPESFYREEWERVIQPNGIRTLEDYFKVVRSGRGVSINRVVRKKVWAVFQEYRNLLSENSLSEINDAMLDAAVVLENSKTGTGYRAIIVDEAQDMGQQAFRLLRKMLPEGKNDIFIVGDAHQRIYGNQAVLGKCGINIVGRAHKLKINYRTTDETKNWAMHLLLEDQADDLDGGSDDQKGYKSLMHGNAPLVKHFAEFKDEIAFIKDYLQKLPASENQLANVCLVARTESLRDQYAQAIGNEIKTILIHRTEPEDRSRPGLRLATMHRVKGLEFDYMLIVGVNRGVVPLERVEARSDDPVINGDQEKQERALLYVAATRAKKEVLVTSHGTPSPFLVK